MKVPLCCHFHRAASLTSLPSGKTAWGALNGLLASDGDRGYSPAELPSCNRPRRFEFALRRAPHELSTVAPGSETSLPARFCEATIQPNI